MLECARNLACVGAEPLGLTNCLNFGNPEKPHIAWQLTRAVEGLRDACLALGVPVVGGNVSLYNEGGGGPIYPTPIVGMVGKLPDPATVPRVGLRRPRATRSRVAGPFAPALEGSELEKLRGALALRAPGGGPRRPGRGAGRAARRGARGRAADCVHDVAEGGVAVALAECCIEGDIGARLSLDAADETSLFGEGPGGVLVAGPAEAVAAVPGARVIGDGRRRRARAGGGAADPGGGAARGLRGRDPGAARGRLLKRAATTGAAGTLTFGPGALPRGDRRPLVSHMT